ncbi:hypothetical protein [Clostridium oceanicum]|uniref:Uncharacterized protein n=1 Tax=Clostridium oceanicum TaxID=1543 RepID=A0ABN1JT96_9CLOT
MTFVKIDNNLSKSQIESKAKNLGMEYPQDMKVINKANSNKPKKSK